MQRSVLVCYGAVARNPWLRRCEEKYYGEWEGPPVRLLERH